MPHRTAPFRRLARTAVVCTATLTALALGADLATSAWAKSSVRVGVSAHVLRLGQSLTVTGSGGDDAARSYRICLDERPSGSNWRQLACAARPFAPVRASYRGVRRGTVQFRARLVALPAKRRDRTSAPVTVVVR